MRKTIARAGAFALVLLCFFSITFAQNPTVTGTVTDQAGAGIPGVTVTVRGTNIATQTDAQGRYSINAPANAVLVLSSVGYGTTEVNVAGQTAITSSLTTQGANLNEVVVVGYGTARRKDITGSIATVGAKDFNKGVQVSADQLIQGKVAGVQVLNNSGQPGGAVSVRIRGASSVRTGNQPLFVVDGVPLDGGSARPGFDAPGGLGGTPDANPLNYINPNDIASIDVLKDASAAAIYGSRGANGVVIITTKRGQTGAPKIDFTISAGVSNMLRQLKVLNGDEYRDALTKYGIASTNNYGGNVDAMDEITRSAIVQNYNAAVSGGNENGRYRLSLGYLNQEGIVIGSGLKRLTSNFNGGYKFLESKRLGFDFNLIVSQQDEDLAPVTSNSGFEGSLIGQALQWNPTRALRNSDGSLNLNYAAGSTFPATAYNPLATSEFFNDQARLTNLLASITPYFKFTNNLEYRMILSVNYGTGIRRSQVSNQSEVQAIRSNIGQAYYGNNELITKQITHTLNYTKQLNTVNLTGLLGYEFQQFQNQGVNMNGIGFTSNARSYTNYFQGSNRNQRNIGSFASPIVELQSFFARANVNIADRFILTGTFRADGSNKFGGNNKYGYFPAFAGAWNLGNEEFVKNSFFNTLRLRAGWGKTGNQEFPAGAALDVFEYTGEGNGAIRQANVGNPDLKWETTTTTNIGLDFGFLSNRISGSAEYFFRRTDDLLFSFEAIPPAPTARYWTNLPYGYVANSGFEFTLNTSVVRERDFNFDFGVNVSFLKNRLKDFADSAGKNRLQIQTGAISGQGLTGAYAQEFINDQPLYPFFIGRYLGLDRDGNAQFEGGDPTAAANKYIAGSPNPTTLLGFTASLSYKKLSFVANMNGAFGHYVYNNTTQAALAIGNIGGNRNIAKTVYNPGGQLENRANAQPVSDRYLEKGDYLKMANATLSYNVGAVGKLFRGVNVYVTGQNLFVITNYSGFDPEVNSPRPINDVPSFGIEYTPYPSARIITFGFNFSL